LPPLQARLNPLQHHIPIFYGIFLFSLFLPL
jgi:hypothetical protein